MKSSKPPISMARSTTQATCYLTFPLLTGTTLFVTTIAVVNAFETVDQIYIMTGGGPNNATTMLLFDFWQTLFSFIDFGQSERPQRDSHCRVLDLYRDEFCLHGTPRERMNRSISRRLSRRNVWNRLGVLALGIVAIGWAIPILWAFAVSVHPPEEALNAQNVWFGSHRDFGKLLATRFKLRLSRIYYFNTIVIVGGISSSKPSPSVWPAMRSRGFNSRGQNILLFLDSAATDGAVDLR